MLPDRTYDKSYESPIADTETTANDYCYFYWIAGINLETFLFSLWPTSTKAPVISSESFVMVFETLEFLYFDR
jgi:hypothetical protein